MIRQIEAGGKEIIFYYMTTHLKAIETEQAQFSSFYEANFDGRYLDNRSSPGKSEDSFGILSPRRTFSPTPRVNIAQTPFI